MPRFFIAPVGYETARQFSGAKTPALFLMPEGRLYDSNKATTNHTLEIVAHIAAIHCDFLPSGFCFRTDTTATEYPTELATTIEKALETIAAAIVDYCPSVYPTDRQQG